MSDNVTNLVEFYAKEGAENKNCLIQMQYPTMAIILLIEWLRIQYFRLV